MKIKHLSAFLLTGAISLGAAPAIAESSDAPKLSFSCQVNDGVPTTVARDAEGKNLTVFNWKADALAYKTPSTPKELCDSVTAKLENYSAEGYDLSQITIVGTEALQLPAICANSGGSRDCKKMLFTLTPVNGTQAFVVASDVLGEILNPDLKGEEAVTYNDRGVQSTSYEVNFWDLFRLAPKGIFK